MRSIRVPIVAAVTCLILLLIIPAGAAPTLNLGSTATYQLSASIMTTESCVTDPPSSNFSASFCGAQFPPPRVMRADVDGPVSWTVIGLDKDKVALLNVSHKLNVSVSMGIVTLTPFSEEGSFEQSIDLSTRIESPGTATALLKSLLSALGRVGSGSFLPPGLTLSQLLDSRDVRTTWWVNGPLRLGSPVLVLTGVASVQGSETLNLPGGLGSREAWIVASKFSQSFSATSPPPSVSSTNASLAISLQFDYSKTSDLLLKSDHTINTLSVTQTTFPPGPVVCDPFSCFPTLIPIIVTRTMEATIKISLQLVSTNIDLSSRTNPPGTPGSGTPPPGGSTLPPTGGTGTPPGGGAQAAVFPWVYGIGWVIAAALVGGGLWVARRARRGTKVPGDSGNIEPST